MKRYFIVHDDLLPPVEQIGEWHAIDLGSHGPAGEGHHLVCMIDDRQPVPEGWEWLPPIYDGGAVIDRRGHALVLSDLGVGPGYTMLDVARLVSEINPLFET